MSYIIKTRPVSASPGAAVRLEEQCLFKGDEAAAGDEIFVWFSETQGRRWSATD